MWKRGLVIMNLKAEGSYLATMNLARRLLKEGLITRREYRRFKELMEEKYKPKISLILSDN